LTTTRAALPAAPKILVVEDDPDIQLLISRSLDDAGFHVRTAADGREALAQIDDALPDLIVSDVMMPEMDGLELLSAVRNDPSTRRLPVILLTARSSTSDIVDGLGLGADDYLPKPFVVSELQARVRAKVERPPVPADELQRLVRPKVLMSMAFRDELERELNRNRRGGGAGALAIVELCELDRIRERLGSRALDKVLRRAGDVIAADSRSLDTVGIDESGRFYLLMPETPESGAEIRLRRLHQVLIRQAFEIGKETVRLTPVSGYLGFNPGVQADHLETLALTALDHAAIRLDLEPVRYSQSMGVRDPETGAVANAEESKKLRMERLRLLAQIGGVHAVGVIAPFFLYVLLHSIGINIVPVAYLLVVAALVVTAGLIWIEGYAALQVRIPPEPEGEPPPVSAVIAAYLPNEAATVIDTVEAFLRMDYPGEFEVILAYNTPRPLPVEAHLKEIAERDPRFKPLRVQSSTSKAQNVNSALTQTTGEIIGVFDADHHPAPDSFTRAWRWIASGYDIVQGHCVVRNGHESALSRAVAVEFETIYAVSHPGRAQMHQFGIFGGSNGYWRADLLRKTRMHGFMLTEDIDSSIRAVKAGYRIASDPELISEELAPIKFMSFWNQRMRWAQGWFQVSRKHLIESLRSESLSRRQKMGMVHLLWWREVYPWLSLQMWPIIAFWVWTYGSVGRINWLIPIFVLTTIMTLSVGPGQVLFSYMLAAPQIKQNKKWFWWFLLTSPVYTEMKNVIARVAQVKEQMGERAWKVTPRGAGDPFAEAALEEANERAEAEAAGTTASETVALTTPVWTLFEADLEELAWSTDDQAVRYLDREIICDGTSELTMLLAPHVPMRDTFAVEAEIRLLMPEAYYGTMQLLAGVHPLVGAEQAESLGGGFDTRGQGGTILTRGDVVVHQVPVRIDAAWHVLRLEVTGEHLRLLIDGVPVTDREVRHFAAAGQVGIRSERVAWKLRALRVLTLGDI
jgi:CheY-like chemotaxis protein/cellulose synthase/poly-beta-1,6-N-acetylglucosamine synthase-like glycosyltransferase